MSVSLPNVTLCNRGRCEKSLVETKRSLCLTTYESCCNLQAVSKSCWQYCLFFDGNKTAWCCTPSPLICGDLASLLIFRRPCNHCLCRLQVWHLNLRNKHDPATFLLADKREIKIMEIRDAWFGSAVDDVWSGMKLVSSAFPGPGMGWGSMLAMSGRIHKPCSLQSSFALLSLGWAPWYCKLSNGMNQEER